MKRLILVGTLSAFASQASAGNPEPAPLDPVVVIEETASSGGGILVPLLSLILLAAALSSD